MLSGPLPTSHDAIVRYESVQPRLPAATFPDSPVMRAHLGELIDDIDCFVLDGFGVLNIGERAVPGAVDRIADLQAAGKQLRVLTNGASLPSTRTCAKYQAWGMMFDPSQVVSSRDALAVELKNHSDKLWGFAAFAESELSKLTPQSLLLGDDAAVYDQCDGFVLLSSREWTAERHSLMVQSLRKKPRPVMVGNPDLVAPHPSGLSREPGLYAHDLIDRQLANPGFFGKPFDNAFALIRATVPDVKPSRIAMVGDTLHTDILGGAQSGWKTVLVTEHGLLKGQDVGQAIERSGIIPDYIVPTT
jgi:HAD superfamily hydrolase (TIGR01450 family)